MNVRINLFIAAGLLLSASPIIEAAVETDVAAATEHVLSVAEAPAGGTIQGRIFFNGSPPEPERLRINIDPQTCGSSRFSKEFMTSDDGGLKNVVVWVEGVGQPPEAGTIEVEQKGCVYSPHVQVASVGTTVALINHDPLLHNVHAYLVSPDESSRTAFNLAQPAPRNPAAPIPTKRRLREAGVYRIECDVHPWMRSYVIVGDSRFVAVSDEDGQFTIPDVPAGTHSVRIWHEGLGTVEREVTVTEGGSVTVDLPIEANG